MECNTFSSSYLYLHHSLLLSYHLSLHHILICRLHVYGVDFRNLTALEWFCSYVISNYDRLDAIVNNAAQTVRRPPAYYAHLLEGELMLTHLAAGAESNAHSNSDDTIGSSSSSSSSAAQSARSVLRHQTLFASSLSAAVNASEDKHIESGNAESTAPHSAETHTSISPHATGGVLSDRNTQSVPRGIQMTPSITSSDMTQIMLTKVCVNCSVFFSLLLYPTQFCPVYFYSVLSFVLILLILFYIFFGEAEYNA